MQLAKEHSLLLASKSKSSRGHVAAFTVPKIRDVQSSDTGAVSVVDLERRAHVVELEPLVPQEFWSWRASKGRTPAEVGSRERQLLEFLEQESAAKRPTQVHLTSTPEAEDPLVAVSDQPLTGGRTQDGVEEGGEGSGGREEDEDEDEDEEELEDLDEDVYEGNVVKEESEGKDDKDAVGEGDILPVPRASNGLYLSQEALWTLRLGVGFDILSPHDLCLSLFSRCCALSTFFRGFVVVLACGKILALPPHIHPFGPTRGGRAFSAPRNGSSP